MITLDSSSSIHNRTRWSTDERRELGAASHAPLVVFFGFLHPEEALDRLIAAARRIGSTFA